MASDLPAPTHGDHDKCKCPFCGYLLRDLWEYCEGDYDIQCDNCERELRLAVHVSIDYTLTAKRDSTPRSIFGADP